MEGSRTRGMPPRQKIEKGREPKKRVWYRNYTVRNCYCAELLWTHYRGPSWDQAASCFAALLGSPAAANSPARSTLGRVFFAGRRRTIVVLPSGPVSIVEGVMPACLPPVWAVSLASECLGEGSHRQADGVSAVAGPHFWAVVSPTCRHGS